MSKDFLYVLGTCIALAPIWSALLIFGVEKFLRMIGFPSDSLLTAASGAGVLPFLLFFTIPLGLVFIAIGSFKKETLPKIRQPFFTIVPTDKKSVYFFIGVVVLAVLYLLNI